MKKIEKLPPNPWLEQLKELKCLEENELKQMCEKAKEIFIKLQGTE